MEIQTGFSQSVQNNTLQGTGARCQAAAAAAGSAAEDPGESTVVLNSRQQGAKEFPLEPHDLILRFVI